MNSVLIELCDALDELSKKVLESWSDDRNLKEVYGWNFPPLTRQDLASVPLNMAESIRALAITNIDDELKDIISEIPLKLNSMHTDLIIYLFNGHGNQAVPIYLSTLEWVKNTLLPLTRWENFQDNKAMPTALSRRLRAIQTDLDNIIPNKANLTEQINLINDATEAAESLPTDLENLKHARAKVAEIHEDSSFDRKKITEHKSSVEAQLKSINELHVQAQQLIENCEDAYRITTTKGLASAFDQRASDLKWSMRCWVGGLLFALAVGAYIGHARIEVLTQVLDNPRVSLGIICIQIVLSLTSVLAPLWFAWLATKQISQRFKLAEDYDFKASVAKAYEGYKKEAAKIDKEFEARLFNVALTRLEEAPLRLIEDLNHSSPTHELLETTGVTKLGERIMNTAENAVESLTRSRASNDN